MTKINISKLFFNDINKLDKLYLISVKTKLLKVAQSVNYFLLILNLISVNATLQSVKNQFTDNEISILLKPL